MTWRPHRGAEHSMTQKWDRLITDYFNILADESKHPWIRGTAPMRQLSLPSGTTKKGEAWIDKHFAEARENTFRMTEMLTNLVIWQQFLCNSRELATALGRLPPARQQVHWLEGMGIRPNPDYQLGVTLRAAQTAADKAAADAKHRENVLEQLSQLCGLPRALQIGDRFRTSAAGNHPVYHGSSLDYVAGSLGPKTLLGPILDFEVYRRCTDVDLFAGIAVLFEHKGPAYRDPGSPVQAQGEVWIPISENSTLLCCLIEDGKKSIWSDTEDEKADEKEAGGATGAQSSETLPRVTSSTTDVQASSSNRPLPQDSAETKDEEDAKDMPRINLEDLAKSMAEQETLDALGEALNQEAKDEAMPQGPVPAEKRREKEEE